MTEFDLKQAAMAKQEFNTADKEVSDQVQRGAGQGVWAKLAIGAMITLLYSCKVGFGTIGFIPTEPVSIATTDRDLGPVLLNVSGIKDTLRLNGGGQPTYTLHDVRHTAEYALNRAFSSTFPFAGPEAGKLPRYELRLLALSANYYPLGYYSNTEYRANPLSFGPAFSSSTTTNTPYSIQVGYKAALYGSDSLVAVFEDVFDSPGVWTMKENMKKAMERMAEHLDTDVVDFLLKHKQAADVKPVSGP